MEYIFYYDPNVQPLSSPVNEGFDDALQTAKKLQQKGASIQLVDTSQLSQQELQEGYFHAVTASVVKKYKIRQVFGSKRRSGWLFGGGVPALLVYRKGSQFPDSEIVHSLGLTTKAPYASGYHRLPHTVGLLVEKVV